MTDLRRTPLRRLLLMSALMGGASLVEDTATGNPVTFETDVAKPLVSLIANFLPVQASGTPAPDNILPITGWDAVNVKHAGKNLFVLKESEMVSIGWNRFFPNPIKKAGTYTISCKHSFGGDGNDGARVVLTDEAVSNPAENKILTAWTFGQSENGNKSTFTVTEEDLQNGYILFQCQGAGTGYNQFVGAELQIEVGETATDYENPIAPTVYPATFPSTIYGGYVDMVTGEVWATHDGFTKKWGENTTESVIGTVSRRGFISPTQRPTDTELNEKASDRYCSVAPWKFNYAEDSVHFYGGGYSFYVFLPVDTDDETEITIITKRITPVLITTLTPQQINAIKGNNTVWSDANGDCEITFLKKG